MTATSEPVVEYLASTRIGEKGQLTVPKEYRDALGIEAGAPIAVLRVGDGLILMPEQARFNQLCDSIAAALESGGITEPRLQSTLPDARRRVFARRYPKLAHKKAPGRKVKKS